MSHAASDNFLNKYRSTSRVGQYYQQHDPLANEILTKAGPSFIYHRPGYSTEVTNVTNVTTEVTHQPGNYSQYQYKINEDSEPVRLMRPITPVTQRQNVRVRYLQPPELPTPAPIIVKERQLTPPPPAPPIVLRQYAPAPPTPPPLVIRERPPVAPQLPQPTVIEKIVPPPTPPPRQVIVERIPAPEKPREIIYEKWLPYKPLPDRPVIVERGKVYEKQPAPKNVIIEYENPNVNIQRNVFDEGIIRADPNTYSTYGLSNSEVRIVDKINDLPMANSQYTSYTPAPVTNIQLPTQLTRPVTPKLTSSLLNRPKSGSTTVPRGPIAYTGPWNTTYRSSYTGRGFGNLK